MGLSFGPLSKSSKVLNGNLFKLNTISKLKKMSASLDRMDHHFGPGELQGTSSVLLDEQEEDFFEDILNS